MTTPLESDAGDAFDSAGVRIAFDDVGDGPPVVLIHGFASDRTTNWRGPGWYDALVEAGRRVVALDCRGHGASGKPRDPDEHGPAAMADDVVRLLDHLGIDRADVVGYSMGGRIAVQLLVDHADRVNAAVLGGVGPAVLGELPDQRAIATALEAEDLDAVEHPTGRRFRAFATRRDGDLAALAAVMRSIPPFDPDRLAAVSNPVLVVAGEDDSMVGDPSSMRDLLPRAEVVVVPDRDHMTTVGDPRFLEAVVAFLGRAGLAG